MSDKVLKQIWPEWETEGKPLGKGSFGVVYKAVRKDHGVESYAAIKVISIPADPSEVASLRSEGLDVNATRTYLQGIVDDFVSEIQLMESLKGVQNIVSVEDYKVVQKTGEIGWDIYIRMELLTSFNTYICDKKLTEQEVIKLGCDICTALEICAKRNIIHRDIKPENIFINDFGSFKLGDFGIARKMENITSGLSQKGTFNYMAPEVCNSNEYDARVDIYSLGIVLYRLLNGNRLPFLDTEKQLLSPNERKNAVDRRLRGEELPAPCDASPAMADLILRACAYDANMRFSSAAEMKSALMSVTNGTYQIGASRLDRTTAVRKAPVAANQKSAPVVNTFGSASKKKGKIPVVIVAVLAMVLLIGAGLFVAPQFLDGNDGSDPGETAGKNPSETAGHSRFDEQQIASIIGEADALAADEDYENALAKLRAGLSLYPKSSELQEKVDEYTEALNAQVKAKTLDEAKNLALSGDYISAIALIKDAQEAQGDDADYQAALKTYSSAYETEAIADADGLAASGDYIGAIQAINQAASTIGTDETLSEKSLEYENAYIDEVELRSNEYIEAKDFDAAESTVASALKEFPKSEKLLALIDEINEMRPVALSNLTITDSWGYNQLSGQSVVKDTVGNIYNTNNLFSLDHESYYRDAFATYYLGGSYSSITLTLAVSYDGANYDSCLTIYGNDDTVLYTTGTVGRQFAPAQIVLDVSGLEWITFRDSNNWSPNDDIVWLIVNPLLYK